MSLPLSWPWAFPWYFLLLSCCGGGMREHLGGCLAAGGGQPTMCSRIVSVSFYKQQYLFYFAIYCHFLSVFSTAQATFSFHSAAKYGTWELWRYCREKHMPDALCDFWFILSFVTLIILALPVPDTISGTKRSQKLRQRCHTFAIKLLSLKYFNIVKDKPWRQHFEDILKLSYYFKEPVINLMWLIILKWKYFCGLIF